MTLYLRDPDVTLYHGDALDVLRDLPARSADCVVTSPPYSDTRDDVAPVEPWLWPHIFHELARVVRGGMVWNVGRVWRDGEERLWWLDVLEGARLGGWRLWDSGVWVKPNANPLRGRVLADSHEHLLLFGRESDEVTFNADALRTEYAVETLARYRRRWIRGRGTKNDDASPRDGREEHELGARPRSFILSYVGRAKGNPHPTPMPLELAEDLVHLASWPGQTVLDPFVGSGTTLVAARRHGRLGVGIDQDDGYLELAAGRLQQLSLLAS